MTAQELAGCYFMLYFGITLIAMLLSSCILAAVNAHYFAGMSVGISWVLGTSIALNKMGLV